MKTHTWQRYARYLLIGFYILAGVNHFLNPASYLPLIPGYFGFPEAINIISGALEVIFGAMIIFPKTRKWGVWGIIGLLLLFLPSHIYFIQLGGCVSEGLCVPEWVAWVRLLIVHPLLIAWVWWVR